MRDLRYAIRSLARSRGFTIAAILTLAIGIGATTAIYSVVDTILLQPLPFPDADRLFTVVENVAPVRAGFSVDAARPEQSRVSATGDRERKRSIRRPRRSAWAQRMVEPPAAPRACGDSGLGQRCSRCCGRARMLGRALTPATKRIPMSSS